MDAWNSDIASGSFQLTWHRSNGGITPHNMYDGWLDSALATGNSATRTYERLNDPSVNAMPAKLVGTAMTEAQTAALEPFAKYVAANLPIISTTTASQWLEYNSQNSSADREHGIGAQLCGGGEQYPRLTGRAARRCASGRESTGAAGTGRATPGGSVPSAAADGFC